MNNCYARLAILKVMNVIGRARERIHGDSDRADFCGAKKGGYEFRGIRQRNENAIAPGNTLRAKRIPRLIGERGEFAIGYFARFAGDGAALGV